MLATLDILQEVHCRVSSRSAGMSRLDIQSTERMKIYALLISLLLLSFPAFSQTKIDEYVTIKIPGAVQKVDNLTADAAVSTFFSNSKVDSYLVMRMAVISNGLEVNSLPENLDGLNRIYKLISKGQIESMGKKGFLLLNTQQVKFNDYSALQITYRTAESQSEGGESLLLCLNGVVYVFTYSKVSDYVPQHKSEFQKSLKINTSTKQIANVSGNSNSIFSVSNMVSYGILILVLVVFLLKKTHDKSNLGINLKRVYCPVCQTKQPFIRTPLNQRQALYGGHTCRICNTEIDKYGVAIPKNASERKDPAE